MAYEKLSAKKQIATNLGTFIDSQITLLSQNRIKKNLEDEQRFNKAVLEDDLSLTQQLDYRKDQLKRVEDGDRTEKLRLRKEISSLTDRIQQQKFNDAYLAQLTNLNAGVQSIDSTINWLNDTLSRTTDPTIQNSIKDNISQLQTKLYEQQKNALEANTKYSSDSQDLTIIDKQVTNVNNARVKALNAGNDDYVALLDLQLQTLDKAKAEATINKTIMNFSVATMTGSSATALLNEFNKQLEGVEDKTPITIGGTKYDSAKSFWELKRGEYLNDRSANGFFPRYQSELDDKVTYKSTKNILNNDTFKQVGTWYDSLKDRPELATYMERIDQDKQKSLAATADKRATSILNEFAVKGDAKKSLSDLAYIQDTFGVDQSLNYQKIVTSAAKDRQDQINQILTTMSAIMTKTPGITNQKAMEEAIKSGSGANISPETLATNKPADVIKDLAATSEKQNFSGASPAPIGTDQPNKFSAAGVKEGGLYKTPNDPTVYKYEGGTLRPLTGAWDENSFKQLTGKSFSAVENINNISEIAKGEPIVKTDANLATPIEQVGEKIASPDLLKYYKPEDIITKGSDKFLKPGIKSVVGNKLTGDAFAQMQKQYDPATVEKKIIRSGQDIYLKA